MENPVNYFNVHLQDPRNRAERLIMKYYMTDVFPVSLSADGRQIRSLVMKVRPMQEMSESFRKPFILKIQPADTSADFAASKSEISIHWLVTQLSTLALRARSSETRIEDQTQMLKAVLDTVCSNFVRIFDWSAEYYNDNFLRKGRARVNDEYAIAFAKLSTNLETRELSVPGGFRAPGSVASAKAPTRIMAAVMEYGGITLAHVLSNRNALSDSYLMPLLAQEVQMLHALTVMHMSHLDAHADNRFVSDATDAMSALGFFYYHISKTEVLRIPRSVTTKGTTQLCMLKWADFGFSAIHTKDTRNIQWKITPHDRFAAMRKSGRTRVLGDRDGLTFSPAYDMIRFGLSVLIAIMSTLENANADTIGSTLRGMRKSYGVLFAMIQTSAPLVRSMQPYVNLESSLREIQAQFLDDEKYGEPYDANIKSFMEAAKSEEMTFGTASTFESLPVWPLDFLRMHFAEYIKTPDELQKELEDHGSQVLCADMTLRHSPGRANRFFPENQEKDKAAKAGYNHNAKAIGAEQK